MIKFVYISYILNYIIYIYYMKFVTSKDHFNYIELELIVIYILLHLAGDIKFP